MNELQVVQTVFNDYIRRNQMFTVYQIWDDARNSIGQPIDYNSVRNFVEKKINDCYSSVPGWARTLGQHVKNLDNSVGKVGEPPQIYHRAGEDITKYDKDFRLYRCAISKTINIRTVPQTTERKVSSKPKVSGLFRFNVWYRGKLIPCNLVQVRGPGGKFVKNNDFTSHGVLDNGTAVLLTQGKDGELYVV